MVAGRSEGASLCVEGKIGVSTVCERVCLERVPMSSTSKRSLENVGVRENCGNLGLGKESWRRG